MIVKVCKKHGELEEKDARIFFNKGCKHIQCRACNKEWDKKRRQDPEYKRKNLIRSQLPKNREKQKLAEIRYKERRRVANLALYHRKKDDPEYKAKIKKWYKNGYERIKNSLNDTYIKKHLKLGKNASPEMIEQKRLEILEHRIKKQERELRREKLRARIQEIRNERAAKGIVKVCQVHGELLKDQTFMTSNGKRSTGKYYFCAECKRIKGRKAVANLSDGYVARFFIDKSNLKREEIPQELIEFKREAMKFKRKVKQLNNPTVEETKMRDVNQMIDDNFVWEEIVSQRGNGVPDNGIVASYKFPEKLQKPGAKPLLSIRFGKEILTHLGVKQGDYVAVKQAQGNIYNYLLMKASSKKAGYALSEGTTPTSKQISFRFLREGLGHFKLTECKYFPTAPGVIRLVLPQTIFNDK